MKERSSVELRETAERMRTVSTPSRRTRRKTKKRPVLEVLPTSLATFYLDLALHAAGGAVHEPDHGDDEEGGGEHDPSLEDVGIEVEVGDDDGDSDAGGEGCSESPEDGALEFVATDFGEVGEDDADDERGFDAFAGLDDKYLQHNELTCLIFHVLIQCRTLGRQSGGGLLRGDPLPLFACHSLGVTRILDLVCKLLILKGWVPIRGRGLFLGLGLVVSDPTINAASLALIMGTLHRGAPWGWDWIFGGVYGAPGAIRTPDLLVRSQLLYPAELRAHITRSTTV